MKFSVGNIVKIITGECNDEIGIIVGKSDFGAFYYNVKLLESETVAPFYRDDMVIYMA